ncbi:hypothetical protein M422DRAFT_255196 [Sphaerobolus stellatus SS14]|uniref:Uncharacterized protein n=1 Tax=Sphaerobolus stellatus (strain SS14) TaxID=990650 RepID=A0A0C9VJS1_SPHS4|nr:hypothetical protein M422DRAFT_255196 [Sphaerobolus stellatus SS14]
MATGLKFNETLEMTRQMLDARLLVSTNEGYQYKARVTKLTGSLIFVYAQITSTLASCPCLR